MLGYEYKDIQEFGATLDLAELLAVNNGKPEIKEGLLKIWDFFEGLLAEGHIEGGVKV